MNGTLERISVISSHLGANDCVATDSSMKKQTKPKNNAKPGIDYYDFEDLLKPEEIQTRRKAKEFAQNELAKIDLNRYYESAEFPFEAIEKLKKLNWVGAGMKGYTCSGIGAVDSGLIGMEMAKVSTDISTMYTILQNISMSPIYYCGSEAQKSKYLPKMVSMDLIGAFALTEPNAGSDAAGLHCQAKRVPGGWLLNGEKRWIGNAPIADIIIIWARNQDTNEVNGFIVEKNTKGFKVEKMEFKVAVRSIQNGHIYLNDCFIPDEQRLPLAENFASGPGKSLFLTRIIASWIALGIAANAYEKCLDYVNQRVQFNSPLSHNQLVQERLVRMLGNLQAMSLMCLRVSRLFDTNKLSYGQVGLLKAFVTLRGREVVSLARELLGGNGLVTNYDVAKNFVDLEAAYTFEGTYDINTLITGREITNYAAFKSR